MVDESVGATGRPAPYRRDGFTWAAFGALGGFGFLNAVLGPALPYLRAAEGLSYVLGAAHQAAFAVGGGLAGLLAARGGRGGRGGRGPSRAVVVRLGLVGAALAGVGIGYGGRPAITIGAAFLVSLLGTSALIRLWAALSDTHAAHRTVAMTEGEVSVSLGSILAPLLVGGLAATAAGWRSSFVVGGAVVVAAVALSTVVPVPPAAPRPAAGAPRDATAAQAAGSAPTLVVVLAIVALEFSLSLWLASYLDEDVGLPRDVAATMVAVLYAANLAGRVVASRLARRAAPARLLALSIGLATVGLPVLLTATGAAAATVGLVVAGAGIGATFPLASSLHVAASPRSADAAVGQVLLVAAVGQVVGPLAVAVLAQAAGLRVALLVLPALALVAAGALVRHRSGTRARAAP